MLEANFFDGFVFWTVTWQQDEKSLYFVADTQERHSTFPILEASICYSALRVEELTGVGQTLLITAQVALHSNLPFQITKTSERRFSLAVALGVD